MNAPVAAPARRPSLARRSLAVLVAIVACLALVEIGLRLLGIPRAASRVDFVNPEWRDQAHFPRDPDTFWRLAPDDEVFAPVNGLGLFGAEPDPQKSDRHFRIAIVGGSPAIASKVDFDDGFAMQLERATQDEAPGARVETLIAAVPGFSTFQSLRLWQRVGPAFAPDLVVLYCGADADYWPAVTAPDAELARQPSDPSPWQLARLARALFGAGTPASATEHQATRAADDGSRRRRVPLPEFVANVQALIAAAASAGAEVCVVIPALSPDLEKRLPVVLEYRNAMRQAAQARQAYTLDAAGLITAYQGSMDRPPCDDVGEVHGLRDDTHLSVPAHTLLAQMLLTRVRTHARFAALSALRPTDAPTVTNVQPPRVDALAGTEITVTGQGFAASKGLRLWLGRQSVLPLRVIDDHTLQARVPVELAPGRHSLRLTSDRGRSVVADDITLEVAPCPIDASLRRAGDHVHVELEGHAPPGSAVRIFVAPAGRAKAIDTAAGPFWLQVGVPGEKPARAPFCFSALPFTSFTCTAPAGGRWQIQAAWHPDATFANAVLQGVVWLPGDRAMAVTTAVAVRVVPR